MPGGQPQSWTQQRAGNMPRESLRREVLWLQASVGTAESQQELGHPGRAIHPHDALSMPGGSRAAQPVLQTKHLPVAAPA